MKKLNLKYFINCFFIGLGILVLGILIGTVLLMSVFALPVEEMQKNVARSSEIYNHEGVYPMLIHEYKMSQMDNCTDAIMFGHAIYAWENENTLEKAMRVKRVGYYDKDIVLSLTNYANQVEGNIFEVGYDRYWHGYLVFLKPLLLFFDIGDLRVLAMYTQTVLLIILLVIMANVRGGGVRKYIPSMVLIYLMLMPPAINFCFQFMAVYYIMMITLIVLIRRYEKWKNKKYMFLVMFLIVGMITSYLDFLTYPLVTFGIPMIMLMLLNNDKVLKKAAKEIFFCMIAWGMGYFGMWSGKWIVYFFTTKENIFSSVFKQIMMRTASSADQDRGAAILEALYNNIRVLCKWPIIIVFGSFIVYYLIKILKSRNLYINKSLVVSLIFLGLMPIGWYIILSNHSMIHYWFTYRTLIISVFAGLCILINVSEQKNDDFER